MIFFLRDKYEGGWNKNNKTAELAVHITREMIKIQIYIQAYYIHERCMGVEGLSFLYYQN